MRSSIPQNIITDTGFWLALYDARDQYYQKANQLVNLIEKSTVLIPWPSLYEIMGTRFIKNQIAMQQFEIFLSKPTTILINDKLYKEEALERTFNSNFNKQISLVDMVIRLIMLETNFKIDYLVTFNERDFIDICIKRKIQIAYGY